MIALNIFRGEDILNEYRCFREVNEMKTDILYSEYSQQNLINASTCMYMYMYASKVCNVTLLSIRVKYIYTHFRLGQNIIFRLGQNIIPDRTILNFMRRICLTSLP